MIDTAVVVCPRPERPEAAVLAARVGGLPLLARVLLAAQQAGIRHSLVISSPLQQVTLAALPLCPAKLPPMSPPRRAQAAADYL